MSSIQGGKAIAAVTNGDVRDITSNVRVYTIRSGATDYTAVLRRAGDTCTCKAGQAGVGCWHLIAAHLHLRQERDEIRKAIDAIGDAGDESRCPVCRDPTGVRCCEAGKEAA